MFSDSSSDSDSGIRFKTTTTRQVEQKRSSPLPSRKNNNSYERRDERHSNHRHRDNNHSRTDDRRSTKHTDRKISPVPYSRRRRDDSRDNRHKTRDSDRSHSKQETKRHRSPEDLDKNSKRRSISVERRHSRVSIGIVKSSNGTSTSINKIISTSKINKKSNRDNSLSPQNENKIKQNEETDSRKGNDSKYSSKSEDGKRNDKYERNIETNGKVIKNERQVNISNSKKEHESVHRGSERSKTFNSVAQDRKEKKKVYEKLDCSEKQGVKIDNTIRTSAVKEKVKEPKDDCSLMPMDCDENKKKEKEEIETDAIKNKSKKSKHSKLGKKHKKKKVDMSEGELTPSDIDINLNEPEVDKKFENNKKIVRDPDENVHRGPIGPEIPKELRVELEAAADVIEISDSGQMSSDEEAFGPLPTDCTKMSKAHLKLEERALKMRLDKLQDSEIKEEKGRDEWMLELPDARASHLGLGPRKFRAREGPDMTDRSSWTDTPLTKAGKPKTESESQVSKRVAEEARQLRIQQQDEKQEKLVKKHKKKHKREESLLEIHQKKLRKKKKKEKDAGVSTERRRFDRDIDLGVNRFDDAQKKSILKKAQLLDTRFSKGESKFL